MSIAFVRIVIMLLAKITKVIAQIDERTGGSGAVAQEFNELMQQLQGTSTKLEELDDDNDAQVPTPAE